MAALGFEQNLWNMTNKLRGNLEKSQYKHPILGLIFLKYISDSFDEKYKELVDEGTGLNEDEYAFYEVLSENNSAQDIMGDETLKKIAQELTEAIKKSATVDWNVRESVRAKMRSRLGVY